MASGFWQDVGNFFKGIGQGTVQIVQGIGSTFQANAQFTQSSANLQNAYATNYATQLQMEQEQRQFENKKSMLIILLMFGLPILIILALFAMRKTS